MKIDKFMASSPAFAVLRVARLLETSISGALKDFQLNSTQAGVLLSLFFEQRHVRPGELHRALDVTPSNLSHAVTALERKRWLRRNPILGDARGYGLELTERGKRVTASLVRYFDRMQALTERRLTEHGAARLVTGLEEIREIYR
jgi:DNA-binding MarR family transcriptional regulator